MKPTLNQTLAEELIYMAEIDQAMRAKAITDEATWDSSIDEANALRLQEIVQTQGWPTITMVGAKASHAAWLLVQHAPSLGFMKYCLRLMKALARGEVNPANVAYLEDRVLVMEDKLQIYGTQFREGDDLCPYPIQDPEHMDERRANIGLSSFAENEARMREIYDSPNP